MRMHLLALLMALAAVTGARAADWKLVWSDEFDQPGLPDPKRWTYEHGFIRNNEAQFYTTNRLQNARVEEGRLIIEAHRERWTNGIPQLGRKNAAPFADYTSASLTTRGRAAWTYGRVEVRAKLPTARGTWPAAWMLGTNISEVGWPRCGEIDIMEFVGYEPGVVHANIHTGTYNHVQGTGKGARHPLPTASSEFHVYSVDWHPDRMEFAVDGKVFFTFRNEKTGLGEWPFDADQYLILNLAIGGAWGGRQGIDETAFPQRYEVDYVRVYQQATPRPL